MLLYSTKPLHGRKKRGKMENWSCPLLYLISRAHTHSDTRIFVRVCPPYFFLSCYLVWWYYLQHRRKAWYLISTAIHSTIPTNLCYFLSQVFDRYCSAPFLLYLYTELILIYPSPAVQTCTRSNIMKPTWTQPLSIISSILMYQLFLHPT